MQLFKDYFSKQSDVYVKYRPLYPDALFAWLATLALKHDAAWDCGTGNGQAAIGLAGHFGKVIATDPSESQIANCLPHSKVEYRVAKAENSGIAPQSVDICTVANALHWFDFEIFYDEVNRIVKPCGIIAAWTYALPSVSTTVDAVIRHFHDVVLGDYWLAENRLIENQYKTIPFPFEEIPAPEFVYQKRLTRQDLLGYFRTWSAVQRYIDRNGRNPIDEIIARLHDAWPNDSEKTFTWHLTLKAGRIKLK